ncbi:MAG: hypothetical protein AB7N76_24225 [Planctomycetota bacterium]
MIGGLAALDERDRRALERQRWWSSLLAVPVFLLLSCLGWLRWRPRLVGGAATRRKVWDELEQHPGPLIWVSNHLTLLDPAIVYRALHTPTGLLRAETRRRFPWHVVERTNFWRTLTLWRLLISRRVHDHDYLEHFRGRPANGFGFRALLYLLRTLPIKREDPAPDDPDHPDRTLERAAWLLRGGQSVFVFPEATRARNGWLDAAQRKEFVGHLAERVPEAAFLCLYLRGEGQVTFGNVPRYGESFRLEAQLYRPRAGASAQETSAAVFGVLGELQERWFAVASLRRSCAGHGLVDRAAEGLDAQGARERAARRAVVVALRQAGFPGADLDPDGIEVDLFNRRAVHQRSGTHVEVAIEEERGDLVLALAIVRGGRLGDEHEEGDVLAQAFEVPAGEDPLAAAGEALLDFVAECHDEASREELALVRGAPGKEPTLTWRGAPQDWGVALSHAGRYAAFSLVAPSDPPAEAG